MAPLLSINLPLTEMLLLLIAPGVKMISYGNIDEICECLVACNLNILVRLHISFVHMGLGERECSMVWLKG
ncbi:hypothetical protein TorRG33x02_103090 [Trema orientale]|uniref:Uncharacterized protein n=1 Tax=Trema orientale TaxID=63057 RepID=A0A2P5F828_TREOI|nr:hypothetical protein TorRG33x02_103090 [Trema orientale]